MKGGIEMEQTIWKELEKYRIACERKQWKQSWEDFYCFYYEKCRWSLPKEELEALCGSSFHWMLYNVAPHKSVKEIELEKQALVNSLSEGVENVF
jgi:hypothetical protein